MNGSTFLKAWAMTLLAAVLLAGVLYGPGRYVPTEYVTVIDTHTGRLCVYEDGALDCRE